jgi:phosphate/sulfate permease
MLTKRNYAVLLLATLFAGLFLHSIVGAILGAALTALMMHFRTFSAARENKWNATEAIFNIVLIIVVWAGLFVSAKYPALAWANAAFVAGFLGHIVVGVCLRVFGPRS